MLKWIAQNKYKLMAFMIGLYLLVDVLQHKGQTRLLFPKDFPEVKQQNLIPQSKSILVNKDKNWKKGVNTNVQVDGLSPDDAGFECDIYFDTASAGSFDVHHDPGKSTGYSLDDLFQLYRQKNLQASIWLDIKNLDDSNAPLALRSLIELRNKYNLHNKLLVESGRAYLLTAFSDSGFYTSYYTPLFNPYQMNDAALISRADSISAVLKNSKFNALSGYYFQYPFLKHCFPNYPVLIWAANDRFSLVNRLFKKKINRSDAIFIALYP
ncbi:MAG: hypothetical protein ABIN74_06045 [Ferruginibacter sp.]